MINKYREAYNASFSNDAYEAFKHTINSRYIKPATFRLSETPIFIPNSLKEKLIEACQLLSDYLLTEDFKKQSQYAIDKLGINVPNENAHTSFIQYDFGITLDEKGDLMPKLIEMQGFPSLYCFQVLLEESYKKHFNIPAHLSPFFNGFNQESYLDYIRKVIVGDSKPERVVLLEIDPMNQNTAIDFMACEDMLGIKILDLMDLQKDGRSLYYLQDGKKVPVEKIYNRVIFDELEKRTDLKPAFNFTDDVDVEWIGHPNWFFKISKYTLPFIKNNPYLPKTDLLNTLASIPTDLENYVLKPLFSFSGEGVKFHVKREDIDQIKDPENWILQEKVSYHPAIISPNPLEPIKCEIRMMHTWDRHDERPLLVNNLVRLSKGEMIGVKFNKDKEWVGASVGLFE